MSQNALGRRGSPTQHKPNLQTDILRPYAERTGWDMVVEYVDVAVAAAVPQIVGWREQVPPRLHRPSWSSPSPGLWGLSSTRRRTLRRSSRHGSWPSAPWRVPLVARRAAPGGYAHGRCGKIVFESLGVRFPEACFACLEKLLSLV